MQRVVSQIYWAPTFDGAFGAGSVIKRQADGTVTFSNPFMTSGVKIIGWSVAQNYQGAKTVPQLPHLRLGHQYRLVLHGKQEPRNTVIIRLTFFDIQWQKIKHYDFTNERAYFTVPEDTVNYTLELINAGNRRLVFHRIEICENSLPQTANDDLWFQKRWNTQSKQPLVLLVVPAGVRTKKTYPLLNWYAKQLGRPVQVVSVNHQYAGNIPHRIYKWLSHEDQFKATIIACHSSMNTAVLKLQKHLPTLTTLVTDQARDQLNYFDSYCYQLPQKDWQNVSIADPNWPVIFQAIQNTFGGEEK